MIETMEKSLAEKFAEDGVVCVRQALTAEGQALARAGFDWSRANPSPAAQSYFPETGATFYQDLFNTKSWPHYHPALKETVLPDLMAKIWGSDDVWFFFEQIFIKSGGESRRTPWHQDTSYFPIEGDDMAVAWMSFQSVCQDDALEFVRGSHRQKLYNGSSFDAADDTAPLYDEAVMPRLPDIEANRAAYDIVSWAVEPGDLLIFHPSTLHGGAPTHPGGLRETLTLRFFGEDCNFVARPGVREESSVGFNREASDSRDINDFCRGLQPGDRFRHPDFLKLRP